MRQTRRKTRREKMVATKQEAKVAEDKQETNDGVAFGFGLCLEGLLGLHWY